jgi:hypothetical protein
MDEVQKPVILSVVHHRERPLKSTFIQVIYLI